MVEWRPLIIGILFTLAIFVMSYLSGQSVMLLGFLLGGLAVSVMIDGELKGGVIHGLILGIIAGVIALLVLIIPVVTSPLASYLLGALSTQVIILFVEMIILAIVGGIFGYFMRNELLNSME